MTVIQYLIAIGLSYLFGSIPTAFIIGKLFKGIDIREHGSGNVGATNALRVLGKKAGIMTLSLDVLKGALAVALLPLLFLKNSPQIETIKLLCALSVIAGHIWTIFLNFKGGKGIATSCGAFLSLTPLAALLVIAVWIIVFLLFKYVSAASIISALVLPLLIFIINKSPLYAFFAAIIAVVVILKHKANIVRLLKHEEHKISFKKKLNHE